MTRRALSAAVVVMAALLAGCGDGDSADSDGAADSEARPPTLEVSEGGLRVTLSYQPDPPVAGEPVAWLIALSNERGEALTLTFSSAQEGDVTLLDEDGEEVYRWSEDRVFAQALAEERVEPGGRFAAALADEQLDVGPGTYRLRAEVTAEPAPPVLDTEIEVAAS